MLWHRQANDLDIFKKTELTMNDICRRLSVLTSNFGMVFYWPGLEICEDNLWTKKDFEFQNIIWFATETKQSQKNGPSKFQQKKQSYLRKWSNHHNLFSDLKSKTSTYFPSTRVQMKMEFSLIPWELINFMSNLICSNIFC